MAISEEENLLLRRIEMLRAALIELERSPDEVTRAVAHGGLTIDDSLRFRRAKPVVVAPR